jgi:multisubunit Na+/H+ antiporter MnhB subunit
MNKTTQGAILLIIGIIVLVAVYSMRPPSGFGESFMNMWQGKQFYIKEPFYQILLAVGGIISVLGFIQIFIGLRSKKDTKLYRFREKWTNSSQK